MLLAAVEIASLHIQHFYSYGIFMKSILRLWHFAVVWYLYECGISTNIVSLGVQACPQGEEAFPGTTLRGSLELALCTFVRAMGAGVAAQQELALSTVVPACVWRPTTIVCMRAHAMPVCHSLGRPPGTALCVATLRRART